MSAKPFAPDPPASRFEKTGVTLACVLFAVLAGFVYFRTRPDPAEEKMREESRAATARGPREAAEAKAQTLLMVQLVQQSWSKSYSVMQANFTIRNNNAFDVKDIAIACLLSGNSGTNIDSAKKVLYEIIPAKSKKVFREVNMGFVSDQAGLAQCKIVGVSR